MVARDIYASSVSRAMHLLPGNNPIEDSRMKIIFVLNALLVKDERFQISFFFVRNMRSTKRRDASENKAVYTRRKSLLKTRPIRPTMRPHDDEMIV